MKLILDNGKEFAGKIFGTPKEVQGEVIFNTGMTGYVEALTDPSYKGQILVLTYPLVGNYGVPAGSFESAEIQVQGLIITHYCEKPSHYLSEMSLGAWLKKHSIPGIYGVDTRTLTRHLRMHGAIRGRMVFSDAAEKKLNKFGGGDPEYIDMNKVINLVSPKKVMRYEGGTLKILLLDTGGKENIVRSLVNRGCTVIRAPYSHEWEKLLPEADGVFLTNGPGDPIDAGVQLIERIRGILDINKPIMGICFGHQLLSIAAGGRTYKMKFGNRGVNQPVQDMFTGKCYITSQNHGYVVQTESLTSEWKPWFINLNDKTNEGIIHASKDIWSVQFHPEACPGPNDTAFIFDKYVAAVRKAKRGVTTESKKRRMGRG